MQALAEKLKRKAEESRLLQLLSDAGLRFLGFIEHPGDLGSPCLRWQEVASNAAQPTSIIATDATDGERAAWISSCLEKANLPAECLLSLGGLGGLPWTRIVVGHGVEWIEKLLSNAQELILIGGTPAKMLAFLQEESHDEAHVKMFDFDAPALIL